MAGAYDQKEPELGWWAHTVFNTVKFHKIMDMMVEVLLKWSI